MKKYVPGYIDLRVTLRFCFNLKKSATEAHRMLVEAYGEHAPSLGTCEEWYQHFRNNYFSVVNQEQGAVLKKVGEKSVEG